MPDRIYTDREKIEAALSFVSSDDRETWVQVAMAIKSELGDEGFSLWDHWSSGSPTYKAAAAKAVWKSANATSINIGKLYSLAKRQGFNPKEYRTQLPDPQLLKEKEAEAAKQAQIRVLEEKQKHERAAIKATEIWSAALPIKQEHPYLTRKSIEHFADGSLREMPVELLSKKLGYTPKSDDVALAGRILIAPVGDHSGLTTLEFIDEVGRKSALPGGRKAGAYWLATPSIKTPERIIIGEGIATNASISEATTKTLVVAALSDTNLPNVARTLREQYPDVSIVIASDMGRGEKKAIEAAFIADGRYVLPGLTETDRVDQDQATDFNDQAKLYGSISVANSLEQYIDLDSFDRQIISWWRGEIKESDVLVIGSPSRILNQFGADPDAKLQISQSVLKKATEKHEIELTQLIGLGAAIQSPLAVFASKRGDGHLVLLTEVTHAEGNIIAAIELDRQRDQYIVNDIRSLHPKDTDRVFHWIEDGLLLGLEKTKGRLWLDAAGSNSQREQVTEATLKAILYDGSQNASQLLASPAVSSSKAKPKDSKGKRDFRAELTEKVIEQLEKGTAPWQKPWVASELRLPINATTSKPYNGVNSLWLGMQGYDDPRWATYKQAQAQNWQVRKGEKGTTIEYWKRTETRPLLDDNKKPILDENGKPKTVSVRLERPIGPIYATVFNLSQMDNAPPLELSTKEFAWDPIERAEAILAGSGAKIIHDQSDSAFYAPTKDEIHLPNQSQFPSQANYYSTALHELGHWSGHENRLNRDLSGRFGSESYAREELRAELASYFMAAEIGIPHDVDRHASYVGSWIQVLKSDKNEIFRASRDAEGIAQYVAEIALDQDRTIAAITGVDESIGHSAELTTNLANHRQSMQNQKEVPTPFEKETIMTTDSTIDAVKEQSTADNAAQSKKQSKALYSVNDIPIESRSVARHHFGDRIEIYAPKSNGSYNGVVLNTEKYLVQEVGHGSVVMHDKSKLTMVPALEQLDGARKLTNADLQVHYNDDGHGKVYPFDRQKDTLERTVNSLKKSAKELGLDKSFSENLDKCQEASMSRIREIRGHGLPASAAPNQDVPEKTVTR